MKSETLFKAINDIDFAMYRVKKACDGQGEKVAQNYAECKQWASYLTRRLGILAIHFKQREEGE